MKTVLIYCISCNLPPYPMLMQAALDTWDKLDVPGIETRFYCGGCPAIDHPKILHFKVSDNYANMGKKNLLAFDWALDQCEWDYMARINASCYVRKQKLLDYVQDLPEKGLFKGVASNGPVDSSFMWGGAQFILSRDVIEAICANRDKWHHGPMEDISMTKIIKELGFTPDSTGNACSINRDKDHWLCIYYENGKQGGFEFTDMCEMKKAESQFFIRVKQDLKRHIDVQIMKELFACGI